MTREQKAVRAAQLYEAGRTLAAVARELRLNEKTARRLIIEGGSTIRQRGNPSPGPRDPALDLPIGKLQPSHPFYELDQQMAAARRNSRPDYDGGLGASSLSWVA
jgi:hypothetical protein